MNLATKHFGNFIVKYLAGSLDPDVFMQQLHNPENTLKKGRGEVKVLCIGEKLFACRKYTHGGILRGITGDVFFSEKRVVAEFRILDFLQEHGFPVVHPSAYAVKSNLFTKDLYLLTLFEENTLDLLEFLQSAPRKKRFRAIRDLAKLLFKMGELGVYHPDFHLQNVLFKKNGELIFLDFDGARLKHVSREDMENMLWRLNRFAEKKERLGERTITAGEKMLFLRIMERLSGIPFVQGMTQSLGRKRLFYKFGWLVESAFYRKRGGAG